MNKRIYIIEVAIREIHHEGLKSLKSIRTWAEKRWEEYFKKINV